jgi:hypothetical protein
MVRAWCARVHVVGACERVFVQTLRAVHVCAHCARTSMVRSLYTGSTCAMLGCDGVRGSGLVLDRCGVCGTLRVW